MVQIKHFFLVAATFLFCLGIQAQDKLGPFNFLLGTWKVVGKAAYETWQRSGPDKFSGVGYKEEQGQKKVFETLELLAGPNSVVYAATVPDQNNGVAIHFLLNTNEKGLFSFENPEHDFPKKIQYQLLAADSLYVRVLGDGDKGFSLHLVREQ
jgi:hypothetical protein